MRRQANNAPDLTPGLTSPLFWSAFTLGVGFLFLDNGADQAICFLGIAGTALFTNNPAARATSLVGAAMRFSGPEPVSTLGFFAQMAGLGYAVCETISASYRLQEEQNRENRGP